MHALILAHGQAPSDALLERLREEADLFIVTDGAANDLAARGLLPDVVLGDFDSLDANTPGRLPNTAFVRAEDQEASDLDKAITYARERGATRVTVAGAGGGRIDHTLTSIALLLKFYPETDVRLVDDSGEVRVVSSAAEFHGQAGDILSLIAFAPAEGVTAEGVLWPLSNEWLHPGSRGVSNVLVAETARVSVRSGLLIACHLHGEGAEL